MTVMEPLNSSLPSEAPTFSYLLDKSWKALNKNLGKGIQITLVFIALSFICSAIPVIGSIVSLLLSPGYLICLNRLRVGEKVDLDQLLWGFSDFQLSLKFLIFRLVSGFIILLGLILLLIPGIYLIIALTFSEAQFTLVNQNAFDCMEKSMALVKNRWWYIHNLFFWATLLNIAGLLAFGIGVLITLPLSSIIFLEAFYFLKQEKNET